MIERLANLLKKHEGFRSKPYLDTVNKLTIGWGRNIDDNGISEEEAQLMLDNDIKQVIGECDRNFHWFDDLNETRKIVVLSMVFNMGLPNFKNFKRTIAYIADGNYEQASIEMLDSKWSSQVGVRATELSGMMKNGQ